MPKICLLASGGQGFNIEYVKFIKDFIKIRQGWASWWSFPIKDKAVNILLQSLPFDLYINIGKGVFQYRMTVSDFVSSKGNHGIPPPITWRSKTQKVYIGKTRKFEGTAGVFKTWFKITEIERISALSVKDFEPVKELSKENTLICRSTFGYAYKKGE